MSREYEQKVSSTLSECVENLEKAIDINLSEDNFEVAAELKRISIGAKIASTWQIAGSSDGREYSVWATEDESCYTTLVGTEPRVGEGCDKLVKVFFAADWNDAMKLWHEYQGGTLQADGVIWIPAKKNSKGYAKKLSKTVLLPKGSWKDSTRWKIKSDGLSEVFPRTRRSQNDRRGVEILRCHVRFF
jgi:hypothetical protein